MSNFICSVDSCPVILSSICVIYQGENLIYTGISDGDNLQAALQKIDAAFADAGLGYAFQNGIVQTTPGVPVELGGSLLRDTTIAGNYKLTLAGRIEAARHITTGGTASQFVKGDGTLDSNAYQLAGNYITALTGDGTAVGPGSAALTLATVNANPGTYGTGTLIPRITVDAKGRVTSITTTAIPNVSNILVFEGDVTGSGTTGAPVTLTLATVNPNVYNSLTFLKLKVNAKGLVTGASPVTNLDIEGALGYVPVPNTRTITINGVTQSLQADRSWTLPVGVASVTATAPLVATTGANPNISIPKADATTDGYLDNVDWVTFNGKQSALTFSSPLVNTAGTVSIAKATSTVDGYLSSADWNTFNSKVPSSRTITINGTTYDLSADRSWTINSMVYPSAGIAVSTGTAWGTSITDNSTNWNTAYTERISSATAPLSIASNVISISQASGSTNGYLSSSDWTTFNNKEGSITPGTTSQYWRGDKSWQTLNTTAVVEGTNLYYTDGRVRLALSVSAPLTYDNTTGQFGIQVANASQSGYLTSTDWNTFNNKQASGHYITDLTGEATATGPGIATVTLSNPAVTGKVLTGVNITGGTVVATDTILQAFGKVQNQINSLIGGSIYQGVWNAATNTPTLTSGVGTDGYYYITNVAGNTNLDGITDWHVGDWAIFHGGVWQQVDNTDAVVSVNGYTGAVSLVSSDIAEGATNLYFTNTRARQAISLTTNGTSGVATYNDGTGVLNIPNYNPDLSGYVPATRTLTINGTAFDLTADRSWSVGTVTSVAQLTLGTTGTDITSSVATSTTTPVITLNIPTASATNRGALSAADWTTFNSKQAAFVSGTGFVKISGTTISYDNSTYALDSEVVKLTGDQTIAGLKTFSGFALFEQNLFIKQGNNTSFLPGYNVIDADSTGMIFGLPNTFTAHLNLASLTTQRSYILPNASGTLALTSDLSSYVPYTGATASVNLGTNDLSSRYLNANGGVALGGVVNIKQESAYIPRGNGYSSIASSPIMFDFFAYTGASTYKQFGLQFDGLTDNTPRVYTLPNASGTIALTSDLSSYVPTSRTLTINGVAFDLSANRSWTIATSGGTVTSVAALTLGTTGTDLSSTVATGTTTPVITLNVPTASATNRGALSAADWTTFNNKASTAALANYLLLAGGTMTGGLVQQANLSAWNTTTQGTGVGGVHLGAASSTANTGPAITFGARDASAGANAQAGIYINSDGAYGTRMYLATTDSYAAGSKTAISISETGLVNFVRANPTIQGNVNIHAGNYNSYSPTLTGGGASGTWAISISGNAATATSATSATTAGTSTSTTFVASPDGSRNPNTFALPNTNPRSVKYDFATAGSVTGATGNYAGVMTYTPWDGTSASTGDSSYQLAFCNWSGVNASGLPGLAIRNGINSTWNGTWYQVLHSGNFSSYALPLTGGTLTGALTTGLLIAQGPGGNYNENIRLPGGTAVISFNTSGAAGAGSYNIVSQTNFQIRNAAGTQVFIMDQSGNLTMTGTVTAPTFSGNATSATTANQANSLPTRYDGLVSSNPQQYFNQSTGVKVAMTGAWSVWSDTLWINGYAGGDVLQMCALHTLRNGTPRMAISVQASNSSSYGAFYEFITTYNIANQTVANTTSISSAVGNGYNWTGLQYFVTNNGGYLGSTNSAKLQAYSDSNNSAFMSFHKGGHYAVNFGLDADNVMRIGGWSAAANRWQLDMSGNQTVAGSMTSGTRITAGEDVYSNNGWFYSNNNAGWYNNTYGQGLRQAKGNVSYGNVINVGENFNGWAGYNAQNSLTTTFMTNSSGTHGFYQENGAGWTAFYNYGFACWGLGTDATDPGYSLHIIKYGGSNTGWIIWSDRRIKENIKTIDNALDKVLSLRGVYYNKIDDPNKERCVGYIAQEVLEVVPELVVYSEELDIYNMNYGPMVGMLTEAVKEHHAKTVAQQAEIDTLKQQVQALLNHINNGI